MAGKEAEAIGNREADQIEARAAMSRAIGSRQAERLRKAGQRLRGRARSLMAASGFAADDVGATKIDEALVTESSINELLAVAQAEDEARNDNLRAKIRRAGGSGAAVASNFAAARTLIEGYSTWRDRFGSQTTTDTTGGAQTPVASNWPGEPAVDPYHRNR